MLISKLFKNANFLRFPTRTFAHLDEKQSAISSAIKQIEHSFGKGSIMKLDNSFIHKVPSLSTGILTLDHALGIGGLPLGRIVEIFGPESCGKTSLALLIIASAQKYGKNCTFIDAEHALDPLYATTLGVKLSDLYLSQPDHGEQALNITDILVRSNAMDVIVVDSVAALVPKVEIEGDMGDQHMALQARMMSQALRKLAGNISKSNCILIFINQLRQKVGIVFGNPEVTPGGIALKFFSSVRMDIRRKSPIKVGDELIGYNTNVKIVKNKVAPPFTECQFDLFFKKGIDEKYDVIDMAIKLGIITKSGSWYSRASTGEKLGQGREKVIKYYNDNDPLFGNVKDEVYNAIYRPTPNIVNTDKKNIANTNNSKISGDIDMKIHQSDYFDTKANLNPETYISTENSINDDGNTTSNYLDSPITNIVDKEELHSNSSD